LDYYYTKQRSKSEIQQAKSFLIQQVLLEFVQEYPYETYERLFYDEDRYRLRDWLKTLVQSLPASSPPQNDALVQQLVQDAVESDLIFYTPHVQKKRYKKHKRRHTNHKKGGRRLENT
jgi:hypothetical protein